MLADILWAVPLLGITKSLSLHGPMQLNIPSRKRSSYKSLSLHEYAVSNFLTIFFASFLLAIISHFQILRGSMYFHSFLSLQASQPAGTQVLLWQPARSHFPSSCKTESNATLFCVLHRAFKDTSGIKWKMLQRQYLFSQVSQVQGGASLYRDQIKYLKDNQNDQNSQLLP